MEGQVVQSIQTKLAALIGLAAIAFTSIAVLLYISIARDFLPGIVELTVALSVALIFGIVTLVPRASRHAAQRRLNNVRVGRIGFVAAGAAVLALTAVLAVFIKSFPWPASLLLVVILMAFAIRETDSD